jgi:hypothetical protein
LNLEVMRRLRGYAVKLWWCILQAFDDYSWNLILFSATIDKWDWGCGWVSWFGASCVVCWSTLQRTVATESLIMAGITKAGSPYLRWVLNQCTWVHVRNQPDGSVAMFYKRLRVKNGHPKALVTASGRWRLCIWCWRRNDGIMVKGLSRNPIYEARLRVS